MFNTSTRKRLILIGVTIAVVALAGFLFFLANNDSDNPPAKSNESTATPESTDVLPEPDVKVIEQAFNDRDFETLKQFLPEGAEIAETYDIEGDIVIDPVCKDPHDPEDATTEPTTCPNPIDATYRSYSAEIVNDDGQVIEDDLELVLFFIDDKWVIVDFS